MVVGAQSGQLEQTNHEKETKNKPKEIFERVSLSRDTNGLDRPRPSKGSSNGVAGGASFGKSSKESDAPRTNVRYYICTLSLLVLTTSQMSRMVFNQSMPIMAPTKVVDNNTSTSPTTPLPESVPTSFNQTDAPTETTTISTKTINQDEPTNAPFVEVDNATATAPPEEAPEPTGQDGKEAVPDHETFDWSNDDSSTLKGAFYWGYFMFMIPGGRIAEAYGAKFVLLASVGGSAIVNLATPWLARNNFYLLVSSRIVLGSLQAGVIPGIYALFNKWLTISETSIFAPLVKTNLRLGMMFGSTLCGFNGYNWPVTFYSTGFFCTLFAVLWMILASSKPNNNRWVNKSELGHINKKKRKEPEPEKSIEEGGNEIELAEVAKSENSQQVDKKKKKKVAERTPWLKIISNPSVIGLIMVKLVFNYTIDFLVILLPTYLAAVHKAGPQTVSYITTPMFGLQAVLVVFVGWFAKYVVKERPFKLSKTSIRKCFQVVCNGGMAISMILLTFNNYNLTYVALVLQLTSFLSMFTAGGDTMLPYDLSDKYPATIMAIANCIGNISGVLINELQRYILRGESNSYDQWNKLIRIVAGGNIVGCLAFVLLVKAEPIDFTSPEKPKARPVEAAPLPEKPAASNSKLNAKEEKEEKAGDDGSKRG